MTKKIFAFVLLLAFISLACGLSSPATPDLESIVASTLTAAASQPQIESGSPTQTPGLAVNDSGVQFILPPAVAVGAQPEIIARVEATDDMPYWDVAPEHVKFILTPAAAFPSNFDLTIRFISANEYMQMSEAAASAIPELQTKLNSGTSGGMVVLPPYNAALIIDAKTAQVNFQNGRGLRAIQEYHQAPMPITNDYLIYNFQGITSDGQWLISIVIPIRAPFLIDQSFNPDPNAAQATPVVPEGGLLFPTTSFDGPEIEQYNQGILNKLNQTPDDQFTPSIAALDALVQSILVTGAP